MKEKTIKKIMRWFTGKGSHKYLNGGKGVISIFLAAIMLPFLTMADYLVEVGRYHEAISIMDEAMDSAGMSTLSNYDTYLHDRFGLLAVSQETNIDETYQKYFMGNLNSYTAWDNVECSVKPDYALSDTDVLMQQIQEYSKYSVPAELAGDLLLSKLISQLEKMTKMNSLFSLVSSAGDAADSLLTLTDSVIALKTSVLQLESDLEAYNSAYSKFENAVSELGIAVSEEEAAQGEEDSYQSQLAEKRANYTVAQSEYSECIKHLQTSLGDYQAKASATKKALVTVAKSMESVSSKALTYADEKSQELQSLKNDQDQIKKELENEQKNPEADEERIAELKDTLGELKTQISDIKAENKTGEKMFDAVTSGSNEYVSSIQGEMDKYDESGIAACISALGICQTVVDNLSAESVTSNMKADESEYYVSIPKTIAAAQLQYILDKAEKESSGSGFMDLVNAMGTVFRSLFTSTGIYDSRLDAYIKADASYTPGDIDLVLEDLSTLINYLVGGTSVIEGFINVLIHITDICKTLVNLVTHLANMLTGIAVRAVEAVQELISNKCGEKLLLDEYLLETLSNRTDLSGSSIGGTNKLTGFKFSGVSYASCNELDASPITGGLTAILYLLKDITSGGDDIMFCGAELEYILIGSRSELINQTVAFFNLYIVRLLIDVVPIVTNEEVMEMAEAAGSASMGIGAVIVYVLEILIDPFIDSILIVNKENISLVKQVVYLTPTGIVQLVGHIIHLGISEEANKNIKDKALEFTKMTGDVSSSAKDSEGYIWDYDDYMRVIMLVFGENNTYLERFQNLISLEANAHYGEGKFQISNAYTYLEAEAKGNYSLILPLDNLSDTGFLSVDRIRARGY